VGNKIADKICRMREEGVQFTRDNLINIPYLAHSPELFEMIDYTTMVSDISGTDAGCDETPCLNGEDTVWENNSSLLLTRGWRVVTGSGRRHAFAAGYNLEYQQYVLV
jgi:hypothetical protein